MPALFLAALLLGASSAALSASADEAAAPDHHIADPEDGTLAQGVYTNPYFALAYPLPAGWKEGLAGPPPSNAGYYVLNTPEPLGETKGTILIAAQDEFFALKPMADAMAMLEDLHRSASETPGLTAETAPQPLTIAGHGFARLDLGGVGLSRVIFATLIRCHIVSFTFAASDPALLKKLASSIDRLSFDAEAKGAAPLCIDHYATDATIRHKIAPAPVGPSFVKIPVRIVIGPDGKVKHVHVISAFPGQAKSIADALSQWEFKPYEVQGEPVEIETGIVFEFKPTGR
ncbi:MAG TPA: energy transducer TonB [Stellaceae bacterium]|nr:energy transducer TonB [Stellaceae bacterium]